MAILRDGDTVLLSFQRAADYQPPVWPDPDRPQQFHIDVTVEEAELEGVDVASLYTAEFHAEGSLQGVPPTAPEAPGVEPAPAGQRRGPAGRIGRAPRTHAAARRKPGPAPVRPWCNTARRWKLTDAEGAFQ